MRMPLEPLSDRDLDLLSAYLDDELEPRARGSLERRLAREPALTAALADLRANRALLRGLPMLKAPRSFALDPAVHGRRAPWWVRIFGFENALQLSGALGAAASVILIMLGLVLGLSAGGETQRDSAGIALLPSATVEEMQESAASVAPTAAPGQTSTAPLSATLALAAPAPALEAGADAAATFSDDAQAGAGAAADQAAPLAAAPSSAQEAAPAEESLREQPSSPPPVPPEGVQAFSAEAPGAAAPDLTLQSEGEAAASGAAQPAAPLGALAPPPTRTRTPVPTATSSPTSTPTATRTPTLTATAAASPTAAEIAQAPKQPPERRGAPESEDSGSAGWWLAGLGVAALAASLGVWWAGRRARRA